MIWRMGGSHLLTFTHSLTHQQVWLIFGLGSWEHKNASEDEKCVTGGLVNTCRPFRGKVIQETLLSAKELR